VRELRLFRDDDPEEYLCGCAGYRTLKEMGFLKRKKKKNSMV
jgi:hypothetical protein